MKTEAIGNDEPWSAGISARRTRSVTIGFDNHRSYAQLADWILFWSGTRNHPGRAGMPALQLVLPVLLAFSFNVLAHGDLYLRTKDLTDRIEAGTNNTALLYVERGELKRDHGDPKGAEEDYNSAAQLAPGMPELSLCRGRLLADTGRLQEALAMFDTAAGQAPHNSEVFIGRARLKLKLGENQNAIADYRKGIDLASAPEPEVFIELAKALAAEQRVPEALGALDGGVKKIGSQIKLHSYAFDLELQRQNTNAAISRLDEIIKVASRKENWWAQRGDLLLGTGRPSEARQSYDETIKSIRKLPPRLQQTPAMVALRRHVDEAIVELPQEGIAK